MSATGYAMDDKLSTTGGTMSGTLGLEGTPAYTVLRNTHAGVVTSNGTSAVSVSTTAVTANSTIQLTVQPGTRPCGDAVRCDADRGNRVHRQVDVRVGHGRRDGVGDR